METKTIALIVGVGIAGAVLSSVITTKMLSHEEVPTESKPVISAVADTPVSSKDTAESKKPAVDKDEPVARKPARTHAREVASKVAAPEIRYKTVTKQVCEQKPVTEQVEVADAPKPPQHSPGAMILGGLIGGVVGNQVGDGNGRTLATIAGAGAGAYVGDQVAARNQPKPGTHLETRTTTKEVCHDETQQVPIK
ncbi:hypothetical protein OYT1_ch0096 [Ferriphaselus amnicola]|uniref:Glycine zipper 2TM domain-containing protein n=1 Tax=Ferriphaselus amnicola TaxID=1188319 RepID=A0A2Z6G881_9PROT|nr:glycine zipper 2TM domain-containing protein [Ferriphaselus amnicola]BBE49672.1 hypothetical protein OYT1_ch0096 [Ferriphaselus amnicola]